MTIHIHHMHTICDNAVQIHFRLYLKEFIDLNFVERLLQGSFDIVDMLNPHRNTE